MHFTPIITALAFATGALGWAQAADKKWVANNKVYDKVGRFLNVHESCTRQGTQDVLTEGKCAFWTDNKGTIQHGYCKDTGKAVECQRGCPDPFSPCQFDLENGECQMGYAACLQKMGCGGKAGGTDCIGTATGCSVC